MESSLSNLVVITKLGQPTGVTNDVTKRGGLNSSLQSLLALLKSIYVVKTFLLTTLMIPFSSASFAFITSIYSLRCRGVKPLWLTTLRLYRVKAE
ncbi:hypothetical protein CI238_10822 [Colletotrichum incanum]|uniref:Uncharacterized protein n=1 Tax=Colletotrichum incanum TaxID=1573173 RepID=A0A167BU79_COLIC|nr:hypothetical protein CI238_10822 [Colletotrichum incanum]